MTPGGGEQGPWRDALTVWRVESGPGGVVVHAALALIYCPVTMSEEAYRRLHEADGVEALVGQLLRRERDRQGVVPLGGFRAKDGDVAALLREGGP